MKTTTTWKSGFAFDSQFKNNIIALDDASASGRDDSGFSPKALLLASLAGCISLGSREPGPQGPPGPKGEPGSSTEKVIVVPDKQY